MQISSSSNIEQFTTLTDQLNVANLHHFLVSVQSKTDTSGGLFSFDGGHNLGFFLEKLPRIDGKFGRIMTENGHGMFMSLDGNNFKVNMDTRMLQPLKFFRLVAHSLYATITIIVKTCYTRLIDLLGSGYTSDRYGHPGYNYGMPEESEMLSDERFFIQPPFPIDYKEENFFWYDIVNDPRTREYKYKPPLDFSGKRFTDSLNRSNCAKNIFPWLTIKDPWAALEKAVIRYPVSDIKDNPLSFYIIPARNMIFLPDCVEKFMYLTFHSIDRRFNNEFWTLAYPYIAGWIGFYTAMGGVNFSILYTFPAFNPFRNIVTSIIYKWYSPWIERSFGFLPKIGRSPSAYTAVFAFCGAVRERLYYIVSTMPYVGSEGVLKTQTVHGKSVEGLFFEGIPSSWKQTELVKIPKGIERIEHLSIPNELRTFWYDNRPDLFDYMTLACDGANILPDHVHESVRHFPPFHFVFNNFGVEMWRFVEMVLDFVFRK